MREHEAFKVLKWKCNHEQLARRFVERDAEVSHIQINNGGKNKAPNSANKLANHQKVVFLPLEDSVKLPQIKNQAHRRAILFGYTKSWRYAVALLYLFRRELT